MSEAADDMQTSAELHLGPDDFKALLERLGPSLGLWRAAEVAVLRTRRYEPPVLDLGCGDGIVTSFVLPRVEIGIDPCPEAIRRASASRLYERLENASVEAAAISPETIGTVISNSVLEHVADLSAALRATARLLRPHGHLIFTVPTEAFSGWLALPTRAYGAWRNRHYEHRNLWPLDRWAHHLRQADLTLVAVQPYLRRELVAAWDVMELAQRIRIGRRRLFGLFWRRLPPGLLERLAHRLARLDLAAPPPGGGRLIVARKD